MVKSAPGIREVLLHVLLTWMRKGEIEHLFKNLPLMGSALLAVSVLILVAGRRQQKDEKDEVSLISSIWIVVVPPNVRLPFT